MSSARAQVRIHIGHTTQADSASPAMTPHPTGPTALPKQQGQGQGPEQQEQQARTEGSSSPHPMTLPTLPGAGGPPWPQVLLVQVTILFPSHCRIHRIHHSDPVHPVQAVAAVAVH